MAYQKLLVLASPLCSGTGCCTDCCGYGSDCTNRTIVSDGIVVAFLAVLRAHWRTNGARIFLHRLLLRSTMVFDRRTPTSTASAGCRTKTTTMMTWQMPTWVVSRMPKIMTGTTVACPSGRHGCLKPRIGNHAGSCIRWGRCDTLLLTDLDLLQTANRKFLCRKDIVSQCHVCLHRLWD